LYITALTILIIIVAAAIAIAIMFVIPVIAAMPASFAGAFV
jgi:hypothetical protein